jgi:hypothetical protein
MDRITRIYMTYLMFFNQPRQQSVEKRFVTPAQPAPACSKPGGGVQHHSINRIKGIADDVPGLPGDFFNKLSVLQIPRTRFVTGAYPRPSAVGLEFTTARRAR